MNRLTGKVVWITGGGAGIGSAAAHRFAQEGATVFITGRRDLQVEAEAATAPGRILSLSADVTRPAELHGVVRQITETAGSLDVVYANAGVRLKTPLGATSVDDIDTILATNIKGVILAIEAALPEMVDGGSIILGGSVAGTTAAEQFGVYGATKAAVRSLARTWALELRSRSIRVNSISPGPTDTPMMRTSHSADEFAAVSQWTAEHTPAGRLATPDDIADAALFLASNDSRFVNGIELVVDGGLTQV